MKAILAVLAVPKMFPNATPVFSAFSSRDISIYSKKKQETFLAATRSKIQPAYWSKSWEAYSVFL